MKISKTLSAQLDNFRNQQASIKSAGINKINTNIFSQRLNHKNRSKNKNKKSKAKMRKL
jgi:hypothetical protein